MAGLALWRFEPWQNASLEKGGVTRQRASK